MMMNWDDTERNRHHAEVAEWSWYLVERAELPAYGGAGATTLAGQIGERLRLIYSVTRISDEPAAVRHLMEELETKGV